MASEKHDFIVSLIVRKMRHYGFEVIYLDGKYQNISTEKFDIPPRIINHKPDVIGEKDSKFFCIGEAKTTKDLFTKRTKDQIIDFLAIVRLNSGNKLIIGIPLNAKEDLQKLLIELRVIKQKQIEIIYIPEDLLPYEEEV